MSVPQFIPATLTQNDKQDDAQVAVFIDFENVAITAEEIYGECKVDVIMDAAQQWGRCIIRRAYSDWTSYSRYQQDLLAHAIELTQMFRYSARHRKNAADIQMVVDALEAAFTHPEIEVFFLVTGDSDFSAVARKLRTYGKVVVGLGLRQSTSEVLVKSCDHFILYDTLIGSETRTAAYRLERSRQLLLDAMRTLLPQVENNEVNASQLKMMMLKLDPPFNESELGYRQFRDFVEAQSDLVTSSVRDKVLWVALKPQVTERPPEDELLEHRVALSTASIRLMDPHTRTDILQDLFALLQEESPGAYTLEEAVLHLKAKYDADNVLRSREEVRAVAKLMKYADVFAPRPQSWQLDPLTLKPNLSVQAFVDRCESAYFVIWIRKHLELRPDALAMLLFGTVDQRARVERLIQLAREACATTPMLESAEAATGARVVPDIPDYKEQSPELSVVMEDLQAVMLKEPPSLARAAELNDMGLRIRMTDFEEARDYFIRAARMVYDLIQARTPGASQMDLEWYLSSYCAASAGAHFFRFEYDQAKTYYLAFFALARETEAVWEKIQRLVEPLLSFYFTVAANENNEMLQFSPGRTHPGRIAVALYTHSNPDVREQWLSQVRDLQRVNPAMLRIVKQHLESFERTAQIPGTRDTRMALERIARGTG